MEIRLPLPASPIAPQKRTLSFWLLWLAYLFVSVSGWMRLIASITDWYWLNQAGLTPGPLYLAVTGGMWGLAGLAAVLWIVFRRPWYRLMGLGVALFITLTFWIDQLIVARSPLNLAFAAGFTLFCLAFVILVLKPLPEVRAVFKK